ncbi:hypothetical protein JOD82_002089 [Paenibacillus sp. 1182]|uniref:hypothetical protein n=1 Tax=Paenibacillus sp. 1182 TaxID=2806565 RepID=UPI001AE4ED5B|nr:hypothetical protein [Paenibacillus sp. 1182]MBP1309069.1 hypothetical protein [Paenibacillus sp. 1182]
MACSIRTPGDCLPKIEIGGSLADWAEDAKRGFKELKINDMYDFFEKVGSDISHFPEDVRKAIDDTSNELKRFNMNVNDFLEKSFDALRESAGSFATPEKLAKKMALQLAKTFQVNNNTGTIVACSTVVGGGLVAIGSAIQASTAGIPNPYATYLISYGPAMALWGCSEAYKE